MIVCKKKWFYHLTGLPPPHPPNKIKRKNLIILITTGSFTFAQFKTFIACVILAFVAYMWTRSLTLDNNNVLKAP